MNKCTECGAHLPDKATTCPECGAAQEQETRSPESTGTLPADEPAETPTTAEGADTDSQPDTAEESLEEESAEEESLEEQPAEEESLEEQPAAESVEEPVAETTEPASAEEKTKSKAPWMVAVLLVVAIAAFFGIRGLMNKPTPMPAADKDSPHRQRPMIYVTQEEVDDTDIDEDDLMAYQELLLGSQTLRVRGKGLEEVVLAPERLSVTTEHMPIAVSENGQYMAYLGDDQVLYYGTLEQLAGSSEHLPDLAAVEDVSSVLALSPEGKIVYYLNDIGALMAYTGKESIEIDDHALIPPASSGQEPVTVLENNRIIYRRNPLNAPIYMTYVVGSKDEPVEIGPAYDLLAREMDAEGAVYLVEHVTQVELSPEEQALIDGMEIDEDGNYIAPDKVDPETGVAEIVDIPEQPEPIRDYSAHYYDFKTGKTTDISDHIAQVVWENGKGEFVFVEDVENLEKTEGYQLDLYYFDGSKKHLVHEDVGQYFHLSEEYQYIVYEDYLESDDPEDYTTEATVDYYLQSFSGGKLGEPQKVLNYPQGLMVAFATDDSDGSLVVFAQDPETDYHGTLTFREVGQDGRIGSGKEIDKDVQILTHYKQDGHIQYVKDVDETGNMGDVYLATPGGPELVEKDVWIPSMVGGYFRQRDNENILLATVDQPGALVAGEEPRGTIALYQNGEPTVIKKDFLLGDGNQPMNVFYFDPQQIYFMEMNESQQNSTLYLYNGETVEQVADNVIQVLA